MSSKTKIVVLHMKEIIYTTIFVVLAILLIILFAFMFFPKKEAKQTSAQYSPGVYTSSFTMNGTDFEVEVSVDSAHINGIAFTNLDESITTMYPLIEPALEDIASQIYESQSLENIELSETSPYTSKVILDAIEEALKKAAT